MKKMMGRLILSFMLLQAGGCANVALQERFMAMGAPEAGKAQLYVYRPYVKPSSAYGVLLLVDGIEKAALPTNSYTRLQLQPGEHTLRFGWPAIALQRGMEGPFYFEAGKTYFLKYAVAADFNGRGSLWTFSAMPVRERVAVEEMKCCSLSPSGK
jgi:hypothetical protein